jgi:hypothetical protein
MGRIRFAIKHTEQFGPRTDQMRDAGLQLLEALQRQRISGFTLPTSTSCSGKKWKDSTDQTTTEQIQTHLLKAFEGFELIDLSRDRLQTFLD